MQEFLKGGALSIDKLVDERAPPVIKTYFLVFMLYLDGSEKSFMNYLTLSL